MLRIFGSKRMEQKDEAHCIMRTFSILFLSPNVVRLIGSKVTGETGHSCEWILLLNFCRRPQRKETTLET